MQLQLKTIKGEVFTVEAQEGDNVARLKEIAGEAKSVAVDKLIHQGKILEDSKPLSEYGIKEGSLIIAMFKKEKPAAPAPAPAPAPVAAPAPAASSAPAVSSSAPPAAPGLAPAAAPRPAAATDPSMVMGSAFQATVDQICEMGFPREDVIRALRAAYNNPDRAMQYLLDGIPETADRAPAPAQHAHAAGADTSAPPGLLADPEGGAEEEEGDADMGDFSADQLEAALGSAQHTNPLLQQIPGLAQILALVRANPAALQPLLQELGRQRPEVLQLIQENQEAFLELLNTPGGEGGGFPPGMGAPVQIQVTPEENAAIERLMQLGFPKEAVLEAYFACDKNEELAANFLFENFTE